MKTKKSNKRTVKTPAKAHVEPAVPRVIHYQKILELSAQRTLAMLQLKSRIGSLYDDRAKEFRAIIDPVRLEDCDWSNFLTKRLGVLRSTIAESRKLTNFACELAEIVMQVQALVFDFVTDFREAERYLGSEPPRKMIVEMANAYSSTASLYQREWTEFYALVGDALPPGNVLSLYTADNMLRSMVTRKIALSSCYGKFGPTSDVAP
jgi:hypothetical protein